jgi:hypothetical protein
MVWLDDNEPPTEAELIVTVATVELLVAHAPF